MYMKTLVGSSELYTERFLIALWEKRLPNQVAAILKIGKNSFTTDLLEAADKMYDA